MFESEHGIDFKSIKQRRLNMKVSIKELKVENDGSELLYIRDLGFILNCGTFSNTIKRCDDKLRKESKSDEEHGKHHAIITAAINNISGIVAQIFREPAEPPSSPDETGEEISRA
jgi:hypothetical protein